MTFSCCMEIHDGMRQKKSTVGVRILETKDSRHHYVYDYELLTFQRKPITLSFSLTLISRICNEEQRKSAMEHFDDEQEQVSITIDQNEIPVLESEDDSFHPSVFEEFGFFKSNGLIRMEEGAGGYQVIMGLIARGRMGKDTVVAAIHFVPWSGPNGRGRTEAFKVIAGEISSKRGGNANVKQAWYGGSREEICGIISHGFRRCRQSDIEDGFGVYLSPPKFIMDG
ncbi:hypothetical protein Vadar_005882 [Vaccinium darrowii]|uniref:Uncharacterized protein n=1 Tax=Vaccinium darrowii TaxID=229202 RepID=A0ACB7YU90_9ERIC|nr:hypothetical protein Vadar_005882 [Vaccinium darrowii]